MDIKDFTKEDFLNGLEPYEFLYSLRDNRFMLERVKTIMAQMAQKNGVRNFSKMFSEYVESLKEKNRAIRVNSLVSFEGLDKLLEVELEAGDWIADDQGIKTEGVFGGYVVACVHPIVPVERLVNIDTGCEKLKLAFRRTRNWRTIIVDRKTLASSNHIISLSDNGIGVNSENAKYLVKYLHDIEHLNYDIIPEKNSVSRLGWIDNQGFSPYVDELIFDGEANFKTYFESVKTIGSFDEWKKIIKEARSKNVVNKIIVAASFASILVKPLSCLPFMVHLWGTTEIGKTVALMMATSVWANPELGKYIHSFNSTAVGRERSAAFVNNLPLILDELQVIKDKKQFDQDIYMLCEGAGKVRGNKSGGTDNTPVWANCIITNGEMPITTSNSGGGAVNRILDIECNEQLFNDPREFCNIIKKNYGHAGKEFVRFISEIDSTELELTFKNYNALLSSSEATSKQASSASLLLTADYFASQLFFNDDSLTPEDIQPFLQTKKSVNANERAYEYFCGWVAQNINHFNPEDKVLQNYGVVDCEDGYVYVINNVFNRLCDEGGFNSTSFVSYLKTNSLIKIGQDKKSTVKKRIKGRTFAPRCYCIKIPQDIEESTNLEEYANVAEIFDI